MTESPAYSLNYPCVLELRYGFRTRCHWGDDYAIEFCDPFDGSYDYMPRYLLVSGIDPLHASKNKPWLLCTSPLQGKKVFRLPSIVFVMPRVQTVITHRWAYNTKDRNHLLFLRGVSLRASTGDY